MNVYKKIKIIIQILPEENKMRLKSFSPNSTYGFQFFVFNEVFTLEQYWSDRKVMKAVQRGFPFTPCSVSLLLTSNIRRVHLLQLTNTDTLFVTQVHSLFRDPYFFPIVLYLFPIPFKISSYIQSSCLRLLRVLSFSDFPCFR